MDLQQSGSRRRRKRLSKAQRQFLLKCLGEDDFSDSDLDNSGPTSDMDVAKRMRFLLGDSEDEDDKDESDEGPSLDAIYTFDAKEMARLSMRNAVNFVFIDDDDEEEDGCTDGIEEVFSFDLEKVAEALRRGADQDELSHIIEEAMIQDLPQRIASGSSQADCREETSSTVTPRTGDLSALMTPPCEAPDEGPVSPQFGGGAVSSTDLAARLQKIGGGSCSSRRRRSSIAQHPQLLEAVSTAQSRHRQSLAKVVETELREARRRSLATPLRQRECLSSPEESVCRPSLAQVRRSVAGAQRRRRSSLIRAAEVLEVAGVGIGQQQAQIEVEEHLDLVLHAVERATRRHRQSIHEAMARISVIDEDDEEDEPEPMPEAEPESGGATSPRPQSFFQDMVNEIIAVGYEAFRGCIFRK